MASLFHPAQLTDSIRRPETFSDARGFVMGCCLLWGISALVHGLILMPLYNHIPKTDFDSNLYIIYCVIGMAAATVGTFLLFKLYNAIYAKLVAQEKTQATTLPDVLLYNANAYAMGPSLLTLIPLLGPPLAILWIFVDLYVVGAKRLRLRVAGAIIDSLLSFVVVLVIAGSVYWVGDYLLLHNVIGSPVTVWDVPSTPPRAH